MIGDLGDVEEGEIFADRRALYDAGVHRALQAGIVGQAAKGAELIVLSGGYPDDEDFEDYIIYTGFGGRDPNTGNQIADQEFKAQNQSLVTSCLRGLPVRVIRGGKHKSFAPTEGYRYDGLYRVTRYWSDKGIDGHIICRFRLEAINSDSLPREMEPSGKAKRSEVTIQRIVRDTAVSRRVKEWHKYACQVCGTALSCVAGLYAEGAHIRPLGRPHNGPDTEENLLCLCPNHHVLLDAGGFTINDDYSLNGLDGRLTNISKHTVSLEHLRYHRSLWRGS